MTRDHPTCVVCALLIPHATDSVRYEKPRSVDHRPARPPVDGIDSRPPRAGFAPVGFVHDPSLACADAFIRGLHLGWLAESHAAHAKCRRLHDAGNAHGF